MIKRILSVLLVCVMVFACLTFSTSAQETGKKISLSDLGISKLTVKAENYQPQYYDENGNKVDSSQFKPDFSFYAENLPEKYDLRDYDIVTPVKDQGSLGLCWDFGSTASFESSILLNDELKKELPQNAHEVLDLSEAGNSYYIHTNLKDESSPIYNSFIEDPSKGTDGGYPSIVAMGLSSGYGAYPEDLMPYHNWNNGYNEGFRFYSDYSLKDFTAWGYDVDTLKQCLMERGVMTIQYISYESCYNHKDGVEAYFSNGFSIYPEPNASGHIVSVVGWDDNFSKEYFNEDMRPENDGAWLVKNSWGTAWGCEKEEDQGYFWMSYESNFGEITSFTAQSADVYDNIYQYQAEVYDYLFEGTTACANVFVAENDEVLTQIGFSNFAYTEFTASVYKLSDDYTSPTDGECVLTFDEVAISDGIHNFDCPSEVILNKGDIFSVVIESADGVFIGYDDYNYNTCVNKSFISSYNGTWYDAFDVYSLGYLAIKAYTKNKDNAVYKDELKAVIEKVDNMSFSENVPSDVIDDVVTATDNAKAVYESENATQNDVDNALCLLNGYVEKAGSFVFDINSYSDFLELYDIITYTNGNVPQIIELNCDLDLSEFENFEPLFSGSSFGGAFYGNNHTISNLTINSSDAGFFADLIGATVKDVSFDNFDVTGKWMVGTLASNAENCVISNVDVKNSDITSNRDIAGGLLGNTYGTYIGDCDIKNTTIIGKNIAGVYVPFEEKVYNCTASDVALKSFVSLNYTNGTHIYLDAISNNKLMLGTLKNDKCYIEEYFGEVVSVSVNGLKLEENDGVYEFAVKDGENYNVSVEYVDTPDSYFGYGLDIRKKELVLESYYGEESHVTFPDDIGGVKVKEISIEFEFYNEEPIISMTFEGGLETIRSYALCVLEHLEEVTFEEGVKTIASEMFSVCSSLKTVNLPDSLEKIGIGAFANCPELEYVKLPENLKTIDWSVFANCNKLKNLEIPDSVTKVGEGAFSGCGATYVVLGKNVESIGVQSFGYTAKFGLSFEPIKIPDFTVYGYKGTAAEKYAEDNGFNFVDITEGKPELSDEGFDYSIFKTGDVNLDGEVSILDATTIQRYVAKIEEFNGIQEYNAIVNYNYDSISITEATIIQRVVAKIIPEFDNGAMG